MIDRHSTDRTPGDVGALEAIDQPMTIVPPPASHQLLPSGGLPTLPLPHHHRTPTRPDPTPPPVKGSNPLINHPLAQPPPSLPPHARPLPSAPINPTSPPPPHGEPGPPSAWCSFPSCRFDALRPTERRVARWILIAAAWTLFALFIATQNFASSRYGSLTQPLSWGSAVQIALAEWYAWALLVPLVIWLARRVPFERRTWWRAAPVHAARSHRGGHREDDGRPDRRSGSSDGRSRDGSWSCACTPISSPMEWSSPWHTARRTTRAIASAWHAPRSSSRRWRRPSCRCSRCSCSRISCSTRSTPSPS